MGLSTRAEQTRRKKCVCDKTKHCMDNERFIFIRTQFVLVYLCFLNIQQFRTKTIPPKTKIHSSPYQNFKYMRNTGSATSLLWKINENHLKSIEFNYNVDIFDLICFACCLLCFVPALQLNLLQNSNTSLQFKRID